MNNNERGPGTAHSSPTNITLLLSMFMHGGLFHMYRPNHPLLSRRLMTRATLREMTRLQFTSELTNTPTPPPHGVRGFLETFCV